MPTPNWTFTPSYVPSAQEPVLDSAKFNAMLAEIYINLMYLKSNFTQNYAPNYADVTVGQFWTDTSTTPYTLKQCTAKNSGTQACTWRVIDNDHIEVPSITLVSTNGTKFRVTVTDAGTLTTTAI